MALEGERVSLEEWIPKTKVGRMVKEGKITSMRELFELNLPILEPEIVDFLLPNLMHEVIDVGIVQKQTDAGELSRFKTVVVIGNGEGFVGIGTGKAKQLRFSIEKAIINAKLNIVPVRRGCGSWECLCGTSHSVPFKTVGKSGSVEVVLYPAPKGTGLVAGDIAKTVLRLAGIKDVWSKTFGETRTTYNFAKATYNALKNTYKFVTVEDWKK
ncbi:MAG: 30S ribosomal protein S5 [Fervidicoccaceae archaeon]